MFSELLVPTFLGMRGIPGILPGLPLPVLKISTLSCVFWKEKQNNARCHFCSAHDWWMELFQSQRNHLLFLTLQRATCLLENIQHPFFSPRFVVLFNLSSILRLPFLPWMDQMPLREQRWRLALLFGLWRGQRGAERSPRAQQTWASGQARLSHAPESGGEVLGQIARKTRVIHHV